MNIPYILSPSIHWQFIYGKNLRPWINIKNINELEVGNLKKSGISAIIFDVDNTLTLHHHDKIHFDIIDKFNELQQNFKCAIFSNCSTIRHTQLLSMFKIPIVDYGFKKPQADGFLNALNKLKINIDNVNQVLMVGDRPLTDILGANRLKMKSALVKPFAGKEPLILTIFRSLERLRIGV